MLDPEVIRLAAAAFDNQIEELQTAVFSLRNKHEFHLEPKGQREKQLSALETACDAVTDGIESIVLVRSADEQQAVPPSSQREEELTHRDRAVLLYDVFAETPRVVRLARLHALLEDLFNGFFDLSDLNTEHVSLEQYRKTQALAAAEELWESVCAVCVWVRQEHEERKKRNQVQAASFDPLDGELEDVLGLFARVATQCIPS
eukprot:g9063.t1